MIGGPRVECTDRAYTDHKPDLQEHQLRLNCKIRNYQLVKWLVVDLFELIGLMNVMMPNNQNHLKDDY